MREADVVAAVEDHLALGLVDEAVARARADRLEGRARGRRRRACASISASPAATRWMKASMLVITLMTDGLPSGPRWMTAPPIASSGRRCALEDRLVAADEHGDLARRRLVHAARDRALERRDPARRGECRRGARCSCAVVGAHLDPRRRRAAGPRAGRRLPRRPRSRAAGEGRQVITQSEASATARGEAAALAPAADEAAPRRARSRSWTVSGEAARSRLAASWRPRWPRPMKPYVHAPSPRTGSSPGAASRCRCDSLVRMGQRDSLVELDAEAGRGRRQHVAVLPADRLLQQLRRGCRPSGSMPSRIRKFGVQVASWMLAAPTTGPQ